MTKWELSPIAIDNDLWKEKLDFFPSISNIYLALYFISVFLSICDALMFYFFQGLGRWFARDKLIWENLISSLYIYAYVSTKHINYTKYPLFLYENNGREFVGFHLFC